MNPLANEELILLSYSDLKDLLKRVLKNYNFRDHKAEILADVFTRSSLDGVYSHGVNRFSRFIDTVKMGFVKKDEEPTLNYTFGATEKWNGNGGPGILNALAMMNRSMEIASVSGIGCIGLSNTNHWMRGGTYGWQAAEAGFIGICFTNTKPNMIPWGGSESRLGNNPFVIGIPRKKGHVVMDLAISQYSFGKIQEYAMKEEKLPFPGGFDDNGNLTNDPFTIIRNEKSLPVGLWKGTAMSMMVDLLASILSGGDSSCKIGSRKEEYGLSQVFIAIHPHMISENEMERIIEEVIAYTHDVPGFHPEDKTYYPGEKTLLTRIRNKEHGIPVNKKIYEEILQL